MQWLRPDRAYLNSLIVIHPEKWAYKYEKAMKKIFGMFVLTMLVGGALMTGGCTVYDEEPDGADTTIVNPPDGPDTTIINPPDSPDVTINPPGGGE